MTDEQRARLGFAAQLVLCVSRGLAEADGRIVNPCGLLYSIDNPRGFAAPVKVCGCRYPAWSVSQ